VLKRVTRRDARKALSCIETRAAILLATTAGCEAAQRNIMAEDKTSLFTRPDGRLRPAFWVPALLAALAVFAVIWQAWHGPG